MIFYPTDSTPKFFCILSYILVFWGCEDDLSISSQQVDGWKLVTKHPLDDLFTKGFRTHLGIEHISVQLKVILFGIPIDLMGILPTLLLQHLPILSCSPS